MSLRGFSQTRKLSVLAGQLLSVQLTLVLLAGANSCGNAASLGTDSAGQLSLDNTNDTGGTTLASGVLPSIPLDEELDSARATSELGDPPPPEERVVSGSDFVVQWSGEVQDTALLLDPALSDQEDNAFAFALYKVADLAGRRPLQMQVEGATGEGQEYFVAVADYTLGKWQWFGPASGPQFDIDLRGERQRYVSHAGNMYFLLVAHRDNSVLHAQTTVLVGQPKPDDHPGLPVALRASDGEFPASILLEWKAGEGAVNFELFRANQPAPGQKLNWVSLGFTTDSTWTDTQIIPDRVYCYRVRAINAAGKSAFSNVDPGFAGEAPPPPQQFEIGGRVVQQGTENGIGGIKVFLIGAPNADHLEFSSQQNGEFGFNNLPAGKYIVFPQDPQLEFEPKFLMIAVNNEHPHPMLKFEAFQGEHKRALWGFVYTMGGPDNPGLQPMPNVPVQIKKLNTDQPPTQVKTGEMGFWTAGPLDNGEYDVRPLGPPDGSIKFVPEHRNAKVDGEHMTPALWFRGQGPPPGGGGGDGDGGDGNGGDGGGGDPGN